MTDALATEVARLNNVEQVMGRLGVGRSTVFELFAAEDAEPGTGLRSVKIGRRRLVPEQAIRDFVSRLDEQASTDADFDIAVEPVDGNGRR
jgi:hypothetical protein